MLAAAPWKAHESRRVEPEEVEQLKETSESRNTKSVPLDRAEAAPTDVLRVSGSPGGKQGELALWEICALKIKEQFLKRENTQFFSKWWPWMKN